MNICFQENVNISAPVFNVWPECCWEMSWSFYISFNAQVWARCFQSIYTSLFGPPHPPFTWASSLIRKNHSDRFVIDPETKVKVERCHKGNLHAVCATEKENPSYVLFLSFFLWQLNVLKLDRQQMAFCASPSFRQAQAVTNDSLI